MRVKSISKYSDYVLYTVQFGSLTNAAKALNISQPALSQGISSLEKELGIKIFNRRTSPISLTDAGEIYYRFLRRKELLEKDLRKELNCKTQENNRKVAIGSPAVYVSSVIAPGIAKLADCDYRITVKTASIEKLQELANAGEIDCFISTTENLGENFVSKLIFTEEIVLCTPVTRKDAPDTFPKLSECRFIFLDNGMPLQKTVNEYLADMGINPKCAVTVDQVSEALSLAENGIGCCFASKEAARGRNVKTYPTGLLGRDIFLVYDKELYKTAACTALMDAILK